MSVITENFRESLRYEYDLNPDSIVIDAGAYRGTWAAEINARYGCAVHAFEPIPEFYAPLAEKCKGTRIICHPSGLGAYTRKTLMAVKGDSSGQYADGEIRGVTVGSLFHFIDRIINAPMVDLLKLNVEGMEYEILEGMMWPLKEVYRFKQIQVQFHGCVPLAQQRYELIRKRLAETHSPTFDFGMTWSSWELK